jgi:hypothetical protein
MIDHIRIYQDHKIFWVEYYANPVNGQPNAFQQPIYQQPVYQSLPAVNYAV